MSVAPVAWLELSMALLNDYEKNNNWKCSVSEKWKKAIKFENFGVYRMVFSIVSFPYLSTSIFVLPAAFDRWTVDAAAEQQQQQQ